MEAIRPPAALAPGSDLERKKQRYVWALGASSNVPWWLNTGAPLPILKVAWEFPGDTGGRKSDFTGLIETEKEEGKNRTVMQMIKKVQMLPAAVESMTESIKDNDFAQTVGRDVSRNALWGERLGWEITESSKKARRKVKTQSHCSSKMRTSDKAKHKRYWQRASQKYNLVLSLPTDQDSKGQI